MHGFRWNNYKKVQIHWFFYFYLPWRSFFIVFPQSKKEKWVFSKVLVKWQLLYQTKLTVASQFCNGIGKKQDFLIIFSGHTERSSERTPQFSLPLYFEQVFLWSFFSENFFTETGTTTWKFQFWQRCLKVSIEISRFFLSMFKFLSA